MTSPSGRSRLAFSRFCWAVLVYTIGVILWGAFVRATGSGAGCGSHWPLCDGQVVPRSPDAEMLIEFTHRATSGVAFLLVVVMTVWAYRRFSTGSPVRRAAAASLFFMVVEALLGAGLVIFGLVGDDDSLARAWMMAFHLVNTFLLLGAISLTAWWGSGRPTPAAAGLRTSGIPVGALLLGLALLGMSGAVTALGDTLFPAVSFAEGLRQDFDAGSHILLQLRVYHPVIAAVLSFLVLGVCLRLGRPEISPATFHLAVITVVLYLAQLLIGVVNLLLLAPVWLQLVHLLVADMIWVSAVLLGASALAQTGRVGATAEAAVHAGQAVAAVDGRPRPRHTGHPLK
jgi:heme A synthase